MIPTADRQKATVKVRISFTEDDHVKLRDPATDPRILPDMGVKVTFLEDEKKVKASNKDKSNEPEVIAVIPQGAIHAEGNTKYVFVVKNGVLERHAVTVGAIAVLTSRLSRAYNPASPFWLKVLKVSAMVRKSSLKQ